jgi:hypothetical protein
MRLARKRIINSTSINWLIALIVFTTFSTRVETVRGNPIPWDENWEMNPYSNDYNGSIVFTHEHINITFDEENAYIIANYTFKNIETTMSNLTIFIPFINYENESTKPDITQIQVDGKSVEYNWGQLTENFSDIYPSNWGYEQFNYMEVNLTFNAQETKGLQIHYTRDYMIYNYPSNTEIHYEYRYFVGSLRLWNQSLEKAEFEFWVPKTLCDTIQKPWNSHVIGNNISELIEYEKYYYVSVIYENWTLPTTVNDHEISIYQDFVSLKWQKKKTGIFGTNLGTNYGLFIAFIIVTRIRVKQKTQQEQ